jgi:parallel beta-helix repeat protein
MENLHLGIKNIKFYNILLVLSCFCMFSIAAHAATYYVATAADGGSNSNDGSENSPWKTITYAATIADEGDTVYIKAGLYDTQNGKENVVFDTAGTAANPIIFEGYKTTPGDNPVVNYTLGDTLDPDDMPLLDGGNRATAGIALYLRKSYVIVKNIQIQNYQRAVRACGTNYDIEYCTVENIIAKDLGNASILYDGYGIQMIGKWNSTTEETISTARYNTVKRCIVVNSAAEGISVTDGDNNIIEDCQVYSTDTGTLNEATHYYITLARANNNKVINCYAYRHPNSKHFGHGIHLKMACENNLIKDCVALNSNENFSLRWRAVKYNTFENCISIGGSICIRDGASYNTFRNCRAIDGGYGVVFYDSTEDDGAQSAGFNNTFENCIFEDNTYCIAFNSWSVSSAAYDNDFINCTFYDSSYLFQSSRTNYGNTLTNCIVSNVTNLVSGSGLNYSSSYSNFYSNGFTMPTGIGNISADPKFVDATNGDFRLQANSPCVDAGTTVYSYDYTVSPPTATIALDFDYNYLFRSHGSAYDIGAHEYPDATDPLVHFECTLNITGLVDEMGNVSDGAIMGGSGWDGWDTGIEGDTSGALKLDGTDDYVDFGTPSILNQTSTDIGRSISAWIKLDATDGYRTIVAKNMWRYSLFVSNGRLNGYVKGSTTAAHSKSDALLNTGEWYHVAMSFDRSATGDSKVHLYINGEEVNYNTQIAMVGTPTSASTYKFTIGSDQGNQYFFDGVIDEVKMFDYGLSTSKVFDEYSAFTTVFSADMDEGSRTVVSDSSIYENNGTMYGNTSIINEGESDEYEIAAGINGASWVEGISGRGLKFDGVDDYVDFGTPSVLNQTSTDSVRSISAWIKPEDDGSYRTIVARNIWRYSLFVSGGKLNGYIKGSTTNAHSKSDESLTVGEWQHVVMTFDRSATGDSKVHLYVNGEEVTYNTQIAMVGTPVSSSTYKFTIGSDQGNQYFFDGVIDEVKMFDEALSADQVDALYQKNRD